MNTYRPLGLAAAAATIALVLAQPGARPAAAATAAGRSPVGAGLLAAQVRPGGPAVISRGGPVVIAHGVQVTTSTNWSGYAVTGGTYTYVHASWTVPTASCASGENSQSSTWVGLDGWGSDTVEQTGSTTGCIFGVPAYFPWTEMYPALPVPLDESMSPGDSMTGSVTSSDGGTSYLLVLTDNTKGWTYRTTEAASPADEDLSAEWITELPSCPVFCDDLTDFGSVTFRDAIAIGDGKKGSISSFAGYKAVDMDNGTTIQASVGSLSKNGESFTDRWRHT
jgi:hypothetical protein